ncbi:MAG: c-type cytochrome [Bacteroidota bacterium]|jgi:mono/diheme cytochrome c family protein
MRLITQTFFMILMLIGTLLFSSCMEDSSKPGWEYMPDMAHSVAYETYSSNPVFKDSITNRIPVKGSIPLYQGNVGQLNHFRPYKYSNTPTGYDSAGLFVKNPLTIDTSSLGEGKRLFNIYCSPCHGAGGKGNGSIVENPGIKNPYPPPPSYYSENLLALPEGKMFHSVHYGRNLMGSYASQLDQNQIWMVISYIRSMQTHYTDSIKSITATANQPK